MTNTTRPNHARKIAAGLYEVDTVDGAATVECIDRVWFVTYPGERHPDGFAATLQDAQRQVQAWNAEQRALRPSEWSGRTRVAPDYNVRY